MPNGTCSLPNCAKPTYSAQPEHYSPRCVPCHKRFDLARLDAFEVS